MFLPEHNYLFCLPRCSLPEVDHQLMVVLWLLGCCQLALIQSLRNFTFTAEENCSICNVFAPRCWLVSPFFGFFWMGNHNLLLIFWKPSKRNCHLFSSPPHHGSHARSREGPVPVGSALPPQRPHLAEADVWRREGADLQTGQEGPDSLTDRWVVLSDVALSAWPRVTCWKRVWE